VNETHKKFSRNKPRMNNAPREITARPFNPEVHGQFHQVRNSYGDVVDETRFSFWPEIAGTHLICDHLRGMN
jgi:hypothetical protein